MKSLAVVCNNIKKTFHTGDSDVTALRGINLEVFKSELLMLVGPSGCGKTTLISVIAGILQPTSGSCIVLDKDWQNMNEKARADFRGRNIGFVFQSYNLIPTLTIVENVSIPLLLTGKDKQFAEQRAIEKLELVGLGSRIKALPTELSGGQQQRVAIARSLIHEPQIIVCDEPTAALDHETGTKVMEIFRKVALQDNRTLIVVTHDSRIFHFADRIARLDDGVIVEISKT
jgi:putative ABC transport system ATP-binding protein